MKTLILIGITIAATLFCINNKKAIKKNVSNEIDRVTCHYVKCDNVEQKIKELKKRIPTLAMEK